MADGIQINPADVERVNLLLLGLKNSAKKVLTRAVNKTLTGIRTDAVQVVYDDLNLTKTRIRKNFSITRASFPGLLGRVRSKGYPVNLIEFGAKELKTGGVSVKIRRNGTREKLRHAFIAYGKPTKTGDRNRLVFQRAKHLYKGRKWYRGRAYGYMADQYRFPIVARSSSRIEDVIAEPKNFSTIMQKGQARLDNNLSHELDFELSRV
jgi:hypothetical protein